MAHALAFRNGEAVLQRDPASLAQCLDAVIPIRDLAQIGPLQRFEHRSISATVGGIDLVAGCHTPLHGQSHHSARAAFLLTLDGESQLRYGQQIFNLNRQARGFYLTGEAFRAQTERFNGVLFSLDPQVLLNTAVSMAGLAAPLQCMQQRLLEPRCFRVDEPSHAAALASLQQALAMLDPLIEDGSDLATTLGLDDLIYRCIGLLVFSRLFGDRQADAALLPRSQGCVDVEDYLLANLYKPLRLTELESTFQLSRRTLQDWFKQRHGCGPMQWFRRQRLFAARDRLLQARPGEASIKQISQSCGYVNLTSFSRDFKQAFNLNPSEVLTHSD